MFRYLYLYQGSVFNGDTPFFELEPLQGSDVTRAVIFAGKNNLPFEFSSCYLYLELSTEMQIETVYKNLRMYENLLCLISGQPTHNGSTVDISSFENADDVFREYQAQESEYNQPDIQHAGLVREYNIMQLMPACVSLFNRLPQDHRAKVEKALQTFVVAEEINRSVNAHMKATVVASLHLSAIDQLADTPQLCTHKIDECPECGKSNVQHQKTSHPDEIEKLMRDLFTGNNLEQGVNLIRQSYNRVRSQFLHEGRLAGGETNGGWISSDPTNLQFMEDSVNYANTCRRLLQLYIQKYGNVQD